MDNYKKKRDSILPAKRVSIKPNTKRASIYVKKEPIKDESSGILGFFRSIFRLLLI